MRIRKMDIFEWKSFKEVTLELDQLNVIVGPNNTGKSALLRAALSLQSGGPHIPVGEIRLGSSTTRFEYELEAYDVARYSPGQVGNAALVNPDGSKVLPEIKASVVLTNARNPMADVAHILRSEANQWGGEPQIPPGEPNNFIYPYLSKRKVSNYDRGVDRQRADQVSGTLQNLSAKVARLSAPGHPGGAMFRELSKELLGLEIGAVLVEGGQLPGFTVGRLGEITIETMGEGVAGVLGLLTDLCVAQGNLFLIEEPENDIHPQGLKALLDVIIEKSADNQFIVSTHSNLVVKYLASAANSKLFSVAQEQDELGVPTSGVTVVDTPEGRAQVLRDLGYELYDFDLWEGWLILEESSAELIIRHLIPWFVPRLARVRTLAAGGVTKVEPTFEDFRRLFLFAHLEPRYRERAWVIVDGDDEGKRLVAQLQAGRAGYRTWPPDHFRCWTEGNFEEYYPERFKERVREVLALPHDQKRGPKEALTKEVDLWCREKQEEAKAAFAESAAEIIEVLKEIDVKLFGPDPTS